MEEVFKAGKIKREDVFVATKLWNTHHRPERVKPAFEASLKKLQLDYLDLDLIHTPFAFQPGDVQDPRDANGNVIYDRGVKLLYTWGRWRSWWTRAVQGDWSILSRNVEPFRLLPSEWNRAASFRRAGS